MWAALQQEEIRRLTKTGSSSKGVKIKKEEEDDAALASAGEEEEEGPIQGQVLPLWETGSLCKPVSEEEE